MAENLSILLPTGQVSFDGELKLSPADYQINIYIRELMDELGARKTKCGLEVIDQKRPSI